MFSLRLVDSSLGNALSKDNLIPLLWLSFAILSLHFSCLGSRTGGGVAHHPSSFPFSGSPGAGAERSWSRELPKFEGGATPRASLWLLSWFASVLKGLYVHWVNPEGFLLCPDALIIMFDLWLYSMQCYFNDNTSARSINAFQGWGSLVVSASCLCETHFDFKSSC